MEVARGWLEQKIAGALVRWKKQYYILRADVLTAFTSDEQGSFAQGFLLDHDTVIRILRREHEQRQFCFTLLHHKILYYFSAPTLEEREMWVAALQQQQQNISPAEALVPRYVPAVHQRSQAAAAAAASFSSPSFQHVGVAGQEQRVSLAALFLPSHQEDVHRHPFTAGTPTQFAPSSTLQDAPSHSSGFPNYPTHSSSFSDHSTDSSLSHSPGSSPFLSESHDQDPRRKRKYVRDLGMPDAVEDTT